MKPAQIPQPGLRRLLATIVAVMVAIGLTLAAGPGVADATTSPDPSATQTATPVDVPPPYDFCEAYPDVCAGQTVLQHPCVPPDGYPLWCSYKNPLATGIAPGGTTKISVMLVPDVSTDESQMAPEPSADVPEPADAPAIGPAYQEVPLSSAAVSLSASSGAFSISAPPADVPDAYIGDDGLVDIELVSATADGQRQVENRTVRMVRPVDGAASDAFWVDPTKSDGLYTATPETGGTTSREDLIPQLDPAIVNGTADTWSQGSDAAAEADPVSGSGGSGAGTGDPTNNVAPMEASVNDAATADDPSADETFGDEAPDVNGSALESWAPQAGSVVDATPQAPYCTIQEQDIYHHEWIQIGSSYTEGNSTGSRTWSGSQTASAGVAVSANGIKGTFSASGSKSWSKGSTFEVGWKGLPQTHGYKLRVSYHKFKENCNYGDFKTVTYYYKPVAWTAGNAETSSTTVPQFTHCEPNSADHISRTDSTGHAYSNSVGVNFGEIGITLSSEKNYNKTNVLRYDFASPYTNKKICGDNTVPSLASRMEILIK